MSGLILKLAPKERILINGAVIENGDRRARLSIVTPQVNILRLRDALRPEDANTPVKRIVYTAQLVLTGDLSLSEAEPHLLRGIEQLSQAFRDADSHKHLSSASAAVLDGDSYKALKQLRALLPREQRLLAIAQAAS